MLVLTGYFSQKELPLFTHILKQHDEGDSTSFAMGRKSKGCYFLEENSDTAILLSRLYQKFGGKINTYQISDTIMQSDIPRNYYKFTEMAFNKGNFKHRKWKYSMAREYKDIWKILGFSPVDYKGKTNEEMFIQSRKLENKIRFGFGGI